MNIYNSSAIRLRRYLLLLLTLPALCFFARTAASHPISNDSRLAHEIELGIDMGKRLITATDRVCCFDSDDGEISFIVGANITIDKALFMGKEIEIRVADMPSYDARIITLNLSPEGFIIGEVLEIKTPLVFTYSGVFPGFDGAATELTRGVSYINRGVIGEEGAFLPSSSGWYPVREGATATFDLLVTTPSAYNAVMEGEWVKSSEVDGKRVNRWVSRESLDGINLIVSKFVIEEETYRGIKLYTFFLKEDKPLSRIYFDKTKEYLDLYADILPPYPYKKFAVVESLLPTGYGMPSYTLLGSNVIRLPFIPDTSLGHEFVHNWWGNSVFIDGAYGNWAEALTTYTSDHLYKERAGKGKDYRKHSLESYRNYAGERPISLKEFKFDTTTSGRAVGYNKGSFVFHMLRKLLGDEFFYASLKRFYEESRFTFATSRDIQKAFEAETGMELDWFFNQWFVMSGGPSLALTNVSLTEEPDGGYHLSFRLEQGDEPYLLKIPVLIRTVEGEIFKELVLIKESKEFEFKLSSKPVSLEIDPELDVFRILSRGETPPLLGSFFGSRKGYYVMPSPLDKSTKGGMATAGKYAPVANALAGDFGQMVVKADELPEDVKEGGAGLFIFGGPGVNALFERYWNAPSKEVSLDGKNTITIRGEAIDLTRNVVVVAFRDREDNEKTHVAFLGMADEATMRSIARRVPHLTSKGYLVFKSDGGFLHGSFTGEELLRFDFN